MLYVSHLVTVLYVEQVSDFMLFLFGFATTIPTSAWICPNNDRIKYVYNIYIYTYVGHGPLTNFRQICQPKSLIGRDSI